MGVPSNSRQVLIALHDLLVTGAALVVSVYFRFEEIGLMERMPTLLLLLPPFLIGASAVYFWFDLYRSKWRFASLPDLRNIARASIALALSVLVLDYLLISPYLYGEFFFGKITILLYCVLQMFFLGGPRLAYRYFRFTRTRQHARVGNALPTIIAGRAADADVLLRAIESGAVRKLWPVGILSPSEADRGQAIRGVRVLGRFDDLQRAVEKFAEGGESVGRLVLTPSAFEAGPEALLMCARRIGLSTSRLPSLDSEGIEVRLAPINVEDLLLRPSVKIDYGRLESLVAGRSVVVTGGGGSIGAELCRRMHRFNAARLLIIENSESALYTVLEELQATGSSTQTKGSIADVRDRDRVHKVLTAFEPDIVFHAAALKHVPLLEADWEEGVRTNVFGSVNVADAAIAAGAPMMVLISTDKAIEPVSILGATKRLAEMYCQALDGHHASAQSSNGRSAMRLIAVRFGNVLASNGSVVPKFKAQIEAGGPVTVTHPDMLRYFMTIREACDLVITAATHAFSAQASKVAVYVLNMGQPVRILELAERVIQLSGLEVGRDIEIAFTGMRPGERLNEILFAGDEPIVEIGVPGVVAARMVTPSLDDMRSHFRTLKQAIESGDRDALFRVLCQAVPDFRPAQHALAPHEASPNEERNATR